jgi:hypothetical protein
MRTLEIPLLAFPFTYLIHILEEYWGGEGFYRWIRRVAGIQLTPAQFLSINLVLWTAMSMLVLAVRFPNWLYVALGFVVVVNGLGHAAGTILTRTYSPGLVSGIFLWVPLGVYHLFIGAVALSRHSFWVGITVGFAIQAGVSALALLLGRRNARRAPKILT